MACHLCHEVQHGLGFLIRPFRRAHRRQSNHVTGLDAGIGVRPALVDTHFAAANDAVDVRFGYALELPDQKVVQALASVVFINGDQRGLGRYGWGYALGRHRKVRGAGAGDTPGPFSRAGDRCFRLARSCPYNVFH